MIHISKVIINMTFYSIYDLYTDSANGKKKLKKMQWSLSFWVYFVYGVRKCFKFILSHGAFQFSWYYLSNSVFLPLYVLGSFAIDDLAIIRLCIMYGLIFIQWFHCWICRRPGFDPWVGKIPWRKKGYSLQYSSLEDSMDCVVHGVAKNRT